MASGSREPNFYKGIQALDSLNIIWEKFTSCFLANDSILEGDLSKDTYIFINLCFVLKC